MEGESYFMLMGSLGLTLAGFAGLIAVVGGRGRTVEAVDVWRIRFIVTRGFGVSIAALSTIPLFSATGQVQMTARIVSGLLLAVMLSTWPQSRPGPAWPSEHVRKVVRVIWLVGFAVVGTNVLLASVALLQGLLLFELTSPMGVFVRAVLDHSGTQTSSSEPGAQSPEPGPLPADS